MKSCCGGYPQGALTGHVTGYVSPLTSRELDLNPALQQLPNLSTGKIGVENAMEGQRGKPGSERVEVNARGRPIRVLRDFEPSAGQDVRLALDIGVQLEAAEVLRRGRSEKVNLSLPEAQSAIAANAELKSHIAAGDNLVLRDQKGNITPAESGAVVVMDVGTGEIVSPLVSRPMYDPNIFTERLLTRDWRRLNDHPRTPLLNRVTTGMYAPGSTFKMVVALAALEAGSSMNGPLSSARGIWSLVTQLFTAGKNTDMERSMFRARSNNLVMCSFYEVALKTGIHRIKKMALRLGLARQELTFQVKSPA